jgi:hypothetical protein
LRIVRPPRGPGATAHIGATQERPARAVCGAPGAPRGKIAHRPPLGVSVVHRDYSILAWNMTRGAGPLSLPGQNAIRQNLFGVRRSFSHAVVGAGFERAFRTRQPLPMEKVRAAVRGRITGGSCEAAGNTVGVAFPAGTV